MSNGLDSNRAPATKGFIFNQVMMRIRDPEASTAFYSNVLGMTLLQKVDFPEYRFSLLFFGYTAAEAPCPDDERERLRMTFSREAVLELTHNWGTEADDSFLGYHTGNEEPRGYGHIGITVPDVHEACTWFEENGVKFIKRPEDGNMRNLAFIADPDGYWVEILNANATADACMANKNT